MNGAALSRGGIEERDYEKEDTALEPTRCAGWTLFMGIQTAP